MFNVNMFSYILLAGLAFSCVHSQINLDNKALIEIFGTPPPSVNKALVNELFGTPPPSTTYTPKQDIMTNKDGEPCKCFPFYLCDDNSVAIDANNATVTGYGKLDIRFGNDDPICQESVERCCTPFKDSTKMVKPKSDPSKLRGCGYSNPNGLGATFITNDTSAQFGEFPWVVALIDNNNGSYMGVGVIIHPQVVMSGAHIVSKYTPFALRIRAGEWDTQTTNEMFNYQERDVQEIYYHSDFKPKTLKNDIALLRLNYPLALAEHINVLCLPSHNENFDNSKKCVANGWGKKNFGLKGQYAAILKKVEQDMVSHGRCQSQLRNTRLGQRFKLHNSFVCAGGEEGVDTCEGDGGAALACPIGDSRYKLSGLVAWGIGCGGKDVPGVFTNVPAFRPWIDAKMWSWGYGTNTYTI